MMALTEINDFSYQVIILLVVMLTKLTISRFIEHEPLRFFQFYCQQLSNKVNKSSNSAQQQTVAGFVAIVVTLLPLAVILWLFADFVALDYLWHGLLLYCAFGGFSLQQTTKHIAQAIVGNQSYVAKQTLAPWVLRETEQLSAVGLSKAAIEMQLLRTLQQGYTVAFIFLTLGPLAALLYRLLLEMHYCWNPKLTQFNHFGYCASVLVNICQWLPVRLFALQLLIFNLGKNFLLFWRLSRGFIFQLNNNIAILLLALSLEVKLGGVAMYQQTKLRRVNFNDLAQQPKVTDIIHANKQIKQVIAMSLLYVITLAVTCTFINM
ncbi:cobalamin biosynthesis protein [Colwellia sp. D2M02]|nr:cobalamin biosynthesis protein [Colwellia sp. D2M02]